MKQIKKRKDSWGQYIIYVEKCEKYEYENQSLHNSKTRKAI